MRTNVLLMTSDRSVAAAVSRALSSNGHVVTAVARDTQELTTHLASNPSVVALIDLDPSPNQTLSRLRSLLKLVSTQDKLFV